MYLVSYFQPNRKRASKLVPQPGQTAPPRSLFRRTSSSSRCLTLFALPEGLLCWLDPLLWFPWEENQPPPVCIKRLLRQQPALLQTSSMHQQQQQQQHLPSKTTTTHGSGPRQARRHLVFPTLPLKNEKQHILSKVQTSKRKQTKDGRSILFVVVYLPGK